MRNAKLLELFNELNDKEKLVCIGKRIAYVCEKDHRSMSIDSASDQIVDGVCDNRNWHKTTAKRGTNTIFLDNDMPCVTMPVAHGLMKGLNTDTPVVEKVKQGSSNPRSN